MRRWLVSIALLALAACSRAPDEAATLHVASQRGGTKAVMLASGALAGAPYSVEWSEFPAAQPLLEAVGGGAVDLGIAGDAPFMFAYQSGSPIRAIGAQYRGDRPRGALALVVPAGSSARTLADLKGTRIATTRGSVGHYLVIRALAAAKLPPDHVRFTFLSPGDAKAAFSSGAIDGWATWAPYLAPVLKDHARVIVDSHDQGNLYSFDVANETAIAGKRALLADFLKREARALAWARTHPDAFGTMLARETGLPGDVARDYAVKNAREERPIDAGVIRDQQQVLDTFRAAGAIAGTRPLAGGFVPAFGATRVAATN